MNHEVPILVVGGGPVGLATAALLAEHGVRPLLVERNAAIPDYARQRVLQGPSLDLFAELGADGKLRQAAGDLAGHRWILQVETLAGKELGRTPVESIFQEGGGVDHRIVTRDRIDRILWEAARDRDVPMHFGTAVVAVRHEQDAVIADLVTASGEKSRVRARYLVAADGAHSRVRHMLEFPVPERQVLGHNLRVLFRADLDDLVADRPFLFAVFHDPAAPGMMVPVLNKPRGALWEFAVENLDERERGRWSQERCVQLVRRAIGVPGLDVEVREFAEYTSGTRVADRFQLGRTFLAGDAAHELPPAGMGLNQGLADVRALSPKLARVVRGEADREILDVYDDERRRAAMRAAAHGLQEVQARRDTQAHGL